MGGPSAAAPGLSRPEQRAVCHLGVRQSERPYLRFDHVQRSPATHHRSSQPRRIGPRVRALERQPADPELHVDLDDDPHRGDRERDVRPLAGELPRLGVERERPGMTVDALDVDLDPRMPAAGPRWPHIHANRKRYTMFKHILLATDLSDRSDRAFERAVLLAEQFKARLHLLCTGPGGPELVGDLKQISGACPTDQSEERTEPTLVEMTEKSLELLSQDPDGFFLMVESGMIDKYAHLLDMERAVYDRMAEIDGERLVSRQALVEAVLPRAAKVDGVHEHEARHRIAKHAAWDMMARVINASRDEQEGVEAATMAAKWMRRITAG